jgi:hypothetical protein
MGNIGIIWRHFARSTIALFRIREIVTPVISTITGIMISLFLDFGEF